MAKLGQNLSLPRFRRWLVFLFMSLSLLAGLLTFQAYQQLRWEAFHHHRIQALDLAKRISQEVAEMMQTEEQRSFADYGFFVVAGNDKSNILQRSPLSNYPVSKNIPGALAYFQVDAKGALTSPVFDADVALEQFGIEDQEAAERRALLERVRIILSENRLVESTESPPLELALAESELRQESLDEVVRPTTRRILKQEEPPADEGARTLAVSNESAGFDRLSSPTPAETQYEQSLGRVDDLVQLDTAFEAPKAEEADAGLSYRAADDDLNQRRSRKEKSTALESKDDLRDQFADTRLNNLPIRTFESEVDPFVWNLLDSGHFVMFRKVWREDQRFVQGLLIDQDTFIKSLIEQKFSSSSLSSMSEL
ncbi:MAG: hypothetical protein AAF438_17910, partial [Pseudomonadota bacterium]